MRYQPKTPPEKDDDLQNWIWDELGQLELAFNEQDGVNLVQVNAAPAKPRSGMIRYADGTNWEPVAGQGQGYYGYYAGAWHKLG